MLAVSWTEARRRGLRAESPAAGSPVERLDYFGPEGYLDARTAEQRWALHEASLAGPSAPHAYLVDQKPGSEIGPHFHRVAQYQITVGGSGRIGRHPLALGEIHYADAYTAYGPLVASASGLSYCVLRGQYDPGGVYLDKPGAKQGLRPSRQRYLVAGGVPELPAGGSVAQSAVIALQEDGLGTWLYRLDGGATSTGPDPSESGGQYCVVLRGHLVRDGVSYDPKSVLWVSTGDAPFSLRAGAEGAVCAIMQFPRASGSTPATHDP